MSDFEPSLQAAQARVAAVNPTAYARTRNALDGAVTRLSPYLTHGLLSLRGVYQAVQARHPLYPEHKFVFELGWRAYYRHVWLHLGDGIHQSLHQGVLPDAAYRQDIPADVLQANTGIAVIDMAVRELYATGYLHNHARMWLASYLVHLRKVHWHAGAQWLLGHLLDGDLASNHLSWQWIAGTGSHKPYLFNADNVAKYAPAHWHSPGSVIDTGYAELERLARHPAAVDGSPPGQDGIEPPALMTDPPGSRWSAANADIVRGRDVWLHHPWSLGASRLPDSSHAVRIAVGIAECHADMPWSERRWRFVGEGLKAQTAHRWWGPLQQIAEALREARSVSWQSDPHIDPLLRQLQHLLGNPQVRPAAPEPALFAPVQRYCKSFSQWWRLTSLQPCETPQPPAPVGRSEGP
mgnify:CR=1 FL=1